MTRTATDPLAGRLDDLERIARQAHFEHRIDAAAAGLAARYVSVVRDVLPRITGWGAARAGLMQATDQAVALLARFMRVPAAKAGAPADRSPLGAVPEVTISGILTDGLAVLVKYAESLDTAVTDADVARLLELQRAVDLAFGPGFRPSTGIGDPAREPDPDPDPEPTPDPGPSLADAIRDLTRAIPIEVLAIVLAVALSLAALMIWRP